MSAEITDRQARAIYRERAREVSISHRHRGMTATYPTRVAAKGRNLWCYACAKQVWYTNESGRPAQAEAEKAAGRHLAEHHPQ